MNLSQDEILKLAIKHGIIPMRFIIDTYEAKKSSILAFANAIQQQTELTSLKVLAEIREILSVGDKPMMIDLPCIVKELTANAIQSHSGDGELAGFRFTHLDGSYELRFKPSEQKVAKEEKLFTYPPDQTAKIKELEEIITSWELKSIERESHLDIANKEIEKLSFKLEAYVNGNLSTCDTLLDNDKQIANLQKQNDVLTIALNNISNMTFDSWSNGALAKEIANKALGYC